MKIIIFFIFCLFEMNSFAFSSGRPEYAPPGSPLLFDTPAEHSSQPMVIDPENRGPSQRPFTQDHGFLGWRGSSLDVEVSSSESFPPLTPIPQSQYTLKTVFQMGLTSTSTEIIFSDSDVKYANLSETLSTLDAIKRQTVTHLSLSGIRETLNTQREMGSLSITCNGPLSQYFYEQLSEIAPYLSQLSLHVWIGDEVFMKPSGFIDFLERLPSYAYAPGEEALSVEYPVENPTGSPLML